jgi:hypothetical protein
MEKKGTSYRSRSLISRNRRSIATISSTNPSSGRVSGGVEDGVVCSDEEERSDPEEEGEDVAIAGPVSVAGRKSRRGQLAAL